MKRMLFAGFSVAALMFVVAPAAEAGGITFRIGSRGCNYGYRGYGVGLRSGYGYRPVYRQPVRGYWHDTSHYDYHPGAYVPHGNHYHYIPGHYDWHRTGHWHH